MEYNYIISNGHHLVEIENRIFVIDTGSPDSFSLSGGFNMPINGNEICFAHKNGLNAEQIAELVGRHVDGFIGLDLLRRFGTLIMNKKRDTISFGELVQRSTDSINVSEHMLFGGKYLWIETEINGQRREGIFDTGASLNYLYGGFETTHIIEDYSPTFGGHLSTASGTAETKIGNKEFKLEYGDMEQNPKLSSFAQLYNVFMFLGINGLFEHKLEINFIDMFINLD